MPDRCLTIPVYYDFAATLCYVAHRVLARLDPQIRDLQISLDWRPIDLTSITGWRRGARLQEGARQNILRVMRDLDVEAAIPARWTDSRAALAVALALRGSPSEIAWRERVWSAIFEEGRVITGEGEIERLARDLRIDLQSIDQAGAQRQLARVTRDALGAGINGVPTFMFDNWPVGGIQEDRTMLTLFQRYARKKREPRGQPE